MAPLTHHDIFSLIAPFARRGLQVNLNACDRKARRVVFAPVEHQAPVAASEVIALESLPAAQHRYRIVRTLTHRAPGGDLLAVLGRAWRPLRLADGRATTRLRTARREPAKTRAVETQFSNAVAHLTATLSQPPARFHPRFKRARWGAVLRRMLPLLNCLGLLAVALALQFFVLSQGVAIHPLALGAPPLMMVIALILTRHEMPAFELPPRPKPLPPDAWRPKAIKRERPAGLD